MNYKKPNTLYVAIVILLGVVSFIDKMVTKSSNTTIAVTADHQIKEIKLTSLTNRPKLKTHEEFSNGSILVPFHQPARSGFTKD